MPTSDRRFTGRPLRLAVAIGAALLGYAWSAAAQDVAQVAPLTIDGRPDEALWDTAQVHEDFQVIQPYTLGAPQHRTRVRILGTPEGLAVAFWCEHPTDTPRRAELTARDADSDGDRVNLYLDFDADAKVGYNFMVTLAGALQDSTITNERQFNRDWDGQWQGAAVDQGDHWTAEFLIPWTIASMAGSGAPTRTIGVMFDRVLGHTQERSAWPSASYQRPRFMSEFVRIEVAQYQQSLLKLYPYASLLSNQVAENREGKVGLDVLWKPSGDFQLTAALNPDFGQVEADELVVNFDAIETFFSDKRPFFTENQGLFDVRTPDNGLLVYTRRIGGPRDDDPDRAADIDVAVKVNGRAVGTDYGVLAAVERDYFDDQTGAYLVNRLQRSFGSAQWGYLGTLADRPAVDRRAQVHGFDVNWRPDSRWLVSGQVFGSFIRRAVDRPGSDDSGIGIWGRANYTPSPQWQQELEITHFDRALDFNDLGFQRRASLNELEYTIVRRFNQFPDGDRRRSVAWGLEPQYRTNDQGDRLPVALRLTREAEYADGSYKYLEVLYNSSGFDDLISRGNGLVKLPAALEYAEFFGRTRKLGDFIFGGSAYTVADGIDRHAFGLFGEVRWLPRDDLNVRFELNLRDSPDWMIWQQGTLFGEFRRTMAESALDVNWFPAPRHEVRAKLQWLGLDAEDGKAFRIAAGGHLRPAPGDVVNDFTINNLGFQLRYRWQFAPDSDLYAVYSRGGFREESFAAGSLAERDNLGDLFERSFDLRDADQFLVKVRYGF